MKRFVWRLAALAMVLACSGQLRADPLPTIATFELKKEGDQQRAAALDPRAAWIGQVVSRIDARKPRLARPLKTTLTLELSFVVARNGSLVSKAVAKSSGSAEVDAVALAMLEHAAPFAPMPDAIAEPQITLNLPLRFH